MLHRDDPEDMLITMMSIPSSAYLILSGKVVWQAIIQGLLDHIKAGQPRPGSFGQLLLAARDPATGRALSDAQLFPEIAALFFAGIDTTGHTGTFILCARASRCGKVHKIYTQLSAFQKLVQGEDKIPRCTHVDVTACLRACLFLGLHKNKKNVREIFTNVDLLPKPCLLPFHTWISVCALSAAPSIDKG